MVGVDVLSSTFLCLEAFLILNVLLGFVLLLSRCSWRWRKHVSTWFKMIISYYHHLSAEAALIFFCTVCGMWWWINCRPSLSSAYFVLCADWQFYILIPCIYGLWIYVFVILHPITCVCFFWPVMITMSCTNLIVSVLIISTTNINLRPCHSYNFDHSDVKLVLLGMTWIIIARTLSERDF